MNFSIYHHLPISGHVDIDYVDIHPDKDIAIYIDPERISLSPHLCALAANNKINDFFATLCSAAERRDETKLYQLLSFGKEPNETHLGLSSNYSCGKGSSPEIMLPIVRSMIVSGYFDAGLITQLGDLHLWTPNFGFDRLSDLVTNIIRDVLVTYTIEQYKCWGLPLSDERILAVSWDEEEHRWYHLDCPRITTAGYPTLLVPKQFVGTRMLSSPGKLLQRYALSYRQQEHLDERSKLCHTKTDKMGKEFLTPPTKKELRALELKGCCEKQFLLNVGYRHPNMVKELHADHRSANLKSGAFMDDWQLDSILYGSNERAI